MKIVRIVSLTVAQGHETEALLARLAVYLLRAAASVDRFHWTVARVQDPEFLLEGVRVMMAGRS